MRRIHPFRPLGLAVSLELNDPPALLAELRKLAAAQAGKASSGLFRDAYKAAHFLAQAASLFEEPRYPKAAVKAPEFVRAAQEAARHLRAVVAQPWPDVTPEGREKAAAAYEDFAAGLELMAAGTVVRPDWNNFLTNIGKAIGTIPGRRFTWRFDTLPGFA
ncbi:hypothetical protein BB934_45595 (plasmid) [Microvirga ossetica]|uniref:Uncharacterized protein n=1 Tax=Microvirga ossetica TaxID=1882682 RepID=A0A1B2EZY8_9HYPH|nr:hypothetical protein [Microvirga ossetica]ANY85497.1 hypothetical protein BB934_45595 [Microvirga ossetica]